MSVFVIKNYMKYYRFYSCKTFLLIKRNRKNREYYEYSYTHLVELTNGNILPYLLCLFKKYFKDHYKYHGISHPNKSILIF